MRGALLLGIPAVSVPAGIQIIPGGAVGPASTVAAASGTASLFAPVEASAVSWHAAARRKSTARCCMSVALVARLAETELLHLELQSLARNLEEARGVR